MCAVAAKQGEAVKIPFLALGLDVDAAVGAVVFHIADHIALQPVAMHITPETDIEHPTVNPYGIGFCHSANFNPGICLSRA